MATGTGVPAAFARRLVLASSAIGSPTTVTGECGLPSPPHSLGSVLGDGILAPPPPSALSLGGPEALEAWDKYMKLHRAYLVQFAAHAQNRQVQA